jgi:glutathione S-transferase
MSSRKLYELCGQDPARVFSPFCWRSRMALALKGLDFDSVPWRFTETERLAFASHDKVPVLVDGTTVVADSWAIAQYLEQTYPDTHRLLQGPPATYCFVIGWTDSVLSPGIGRMIVSDIPALLGEERTYFIESREKRYGMTLQQVTAEREARLPAFRATLSPLRQVFRDQPFLGGDSPDYADCAVLGSFMWARSVSPLPLLAPDDTVFAWRERMLDAAGGMARQAPCFGA